MFGIEMRDAWAGLVRNQRVTRRIGHRPIGWRQGGSALLLWRDKITEVDAPDYRRVPVRVALIGGNVVANDAIVFPGAESDWGDIHGCAIYDAPTGGVPLRVIDYRNVAFVSVSRGHILTIDMRWDGN